MRAPQLLVVPLTVFVISCGGDEHEEIEGMVTIEEPTEQSSYQTYADRVAISGSRFTTARSVTWVNAAGGSGTANLTFQSGCFVPFLPIVFSECNHAWGATVPLVIGVNPITVTAYGSDNEWGRDVITVTRLTCPPPPPATPVWQVPSACR